MLSFNAHGNGKPIAIIKGGKNNNKIIYLEQDESNMNHVIKNNPSDIVDDNFIRGLKKKLTGGQLTILKNSLKRGMTPQDKILGGIVDKIRKECERKSLTEFEIHDEGRIQPLPNFNKTERIYIAGPTECGKSYLSQKYMEQLRKVHPKMPIYLFSDVDEDDEIDKIKNLKRVPINDKMLEKGQSPKPEDYSNSIVIFDDIDSIQNKKLLTIIQNFRDAILRRGRHDNISTLITSHLMTNYKDTRIILNEVNKVAFFPRAGASEAIRYTLKRYVGFDKKDIEKALRLPSRWVMVSKTFPQYVMYEKGVYIIT